jgi:hypothetical protein
MPALVNSSVGSSGGTSGQLGFIVWPCRLKKSRKLLRNSFPVMVFRPSIQTTARGILALQGGF